MNFEEHAAKTNVLGPASIPVPRGRLCRSPAEAEAAFGAIGPCVVKAQVPTGKRGKAGGIRKADSVAEVAAVAQVILGLTIDGYAVEKVLLEERVAIAREFYAAVLTDFAACRPLILFSTEGGMEIEEVAAARPDAVRRYSLDIDQDFDDGAAQESRHCRRDFLRRHAVDVGVALVAPGEGGQVLKENEGDQQQADQPSSKPFGRQSTHKASPVLRARHQNAKCIWSCRKRGLPIVCWMRPKLPCGGIDGGP